VTVAIQPAPLDLHTCLREQHASLWRYVRLLGCPSSEAPDLLHDVYVELLRRPPQLRSTGELATYLRKAARHRLIDRLRSRRAAPRLEDLDTIEEAWVQEPERHSSVFVEALRACVAALTVRDRDALELYYRGDASRAELGRSLGLEEEGAKSWLRRVKQMLRQCVEGRLAR